VVQSLDLRNFKAFERFTVNFRTASFLVGPNNAGKSTIIAALRACTYMLVCAWMWELDRFPLGTRGR